MGFIARVKKLTSYIYSPTAPASEDAIRLQIDDSIQEVFDNVTNVLTSTTDGDSGMDIIGMTPIDGVMTTPQQSLEYLKSRVDANAPTLNIVSVLDYGAIGNGVADDTLAIQTALNDASADVIFFPGGSYLVYSPSNACLTLNRNVTLIGAGMSKTYIKPSSATPINVDVLKITGKTTGMEISNIAFITPNYVTPPAASSIHIDMTAPGDYFKNGLISRCYFDELNGASIKLSNLVNLDGFFTSKIIGNLIYGGIDLERAGDSTIIEQNTITGVKTSINMSTVAGAYRTLICKNNITGDEGQIVLSNVTEVTIIDNQIEQTAARASSDGGVIEIDGGGNIIIENNNLEASAYLDYCVKVDNTRNIIIDKNQMHTTANHINVGSGAINTWVGYKNNPRKNGVQINNLIIVDAGVGTTNHEKDLVLENSWVAYDVANHGNPRYVKTDSGIVQLKGEISSGLTTSGTTMFTLPVWARPNTVEYHLCYSTSDGVTFVQGVVQILQTGEVKIRGGSNFIFSLENITFYAENYLL